MPREIKSNDRNEIKLDDIVTGEEVTLFYRTPTTKERLVYDASSFEKKGGKIISLVHQTRQKFGLKILTGFKKGCLACDGKLISSDPQDPDYYAEWKNEFQNTCGDLIKFMAVVVFEGVQLAGGSEEPEPMNDEESIEEVEDAVPLPKS